ncbi:MAG: hypothetical protein MUC34_11345 [Anaerolineae bacterium]|jgi:hypothetical protein|nr:hypothetical protein [Anaerolineae bacterium]
MGEVAVYVEVGKKRAIATGMDWPGWCRSGRTEADALAALLEAAPRYAEIVRPAMLRFDAPREPGDLVVRHRLEGNAGTDYSVPSLVAPGEEKPMDQAEVERAATVLRACWEAFDRAVERAVGKELAKGPRGGGRELQAIQGHVFESEAGYGGRIGLKLQAIAPGDAAALAAHRQEILDALEQVAALGTPPPGPRGGARWPARYFVRRVAYHVVDHTWEIEDRSRA